MMHTDAELLYRLRGRPTQPEWQKIAIRDLVSLEQPGTWGPERGDTVVPVLRSTNFTRDGRLNASGVAWRSIPARDRDRKRLHAGDIVLERSGGGPGQPVGRVIRASGLRDMYCSNFCQQLRPDPQVVDSAFLYRVLCKLYEEGTTARLQHQTTGIRNLDYAGYLSLRVLVPTLNEQRAIARVLDAIDEAIERTEAVIAATEKLRKALNQELLTRGVPGRHTEWKHVPDIGTIPAEWGVARLGELGTPEDAPILTGPFGAELRSKDFLKSGVPVLNIGNVQERGLTTEKLDHVSPETARRLQRYSVKAGDILFSRMATVGRASLVPPTFDGALISYHLMRLRLDPSRAEPGAILCVIQDLPAIRRQVQERSSGATRLGINTGTLSELRIPLPPIAEQREIACLNGSIISRLDQESVVLQVLRRLKAAGTDALLSGRVRITRMAGE